MLSGMRDFEKPNSENLNVLSNWGADNAVQEANTGVALDHSCLL